MEWYVVLCSIVLLLIVLITIGVAIPFALAAASLPFLWGIQSWNTSLVSTQIKTWGVWVDYVLLSVPLFVLLGELVGRSQIGPRLYRAMHYGVPVRGAAAYGSVAACAGFGAVCGSSMVGALTIGTVALPEMLKLGYGRQLSSGIVAAGGTLSVLIPPSLILLYYGIVTDVSIGDLFIAGVVPGLILTGLFAALIRVWRIVRPGDVPPEDSTQPIGMAEMLLAFAPVLLIASIIIVSIYFGIATPTESAAVAVVVTTLLAFGIGGLTLHDFLEALTATLRTMGFLGILVSAAILFGFVLNYYQIPQQLSEAIAALKLSPAMLMGLAILFYLIIGMFLEPTSITFITLPTLFPIIAGAGYDLVWFGIIFTVTMEIAVLTPPVGLNLYILHRLVPAGQLNVGDVIVGSMPFVVMMLTLIGLLLIFPELALWLPKAARRAA